MRTRYYFYLLVLLMNVSPLFFLDVKLAMFAQIMFFTLSLFFFITWILKRYVLTFIFFLVFLYFVIGFYSNVFTGNYEDIDDHVGFSMMFIMFLYFPVSVGLLILNYILLGIVDYFKNRERKYNDKP